MISNDLVVDVLRRNIAMFEWTLADFSDAEMLVRPVPGANHAAWQMGHLIGAESMMVEWCTPGAGGKLPPGFADKFNKKTAALDDPATIPSKAELLALLKSVREASCAWAASLTPADLAKPAPEKIREFVPTVGHVLLLFPQHAMMHLGQLQVIRRKLGKPILF